MGNHENLQHPAEIAEGATRLLALSGCRIDRVLEDGVEIVEAAASDRAFPNRLTESLGICVKSGGPHTLRAAGRELLYPADAVCVRPPGIVWSTPSTGPAGFLSIDIEPVLLPAGGLAGPMRFMGRAALPGVRAAVAVLRSDAPELQKQAVVTDLVNALLESGLVTAPELDRTPGKRSVARARELLTSRVADPPTLQDLADAVGGNRFVLLREFRRTVGMPPHAYLLALRVDRARALLARGSDISRVSHLLGFADQSHLTRVFKRVVGISPAAYRRQIRNHVARSKSFKT